jgi:hypothetical protein
MIRDDQGSRVFGLQIEGLTTRFYFRKSPFVVDSIGEPPNQIQYTDLDCLESISDYSAELQPSGGIATYSPMTINLVMDRMRGSSNDPNVLFGRLLRSSSVWRGQLVSEISRDDDNPIITVDSNPNLTYPHLIHIGAESFLITQQTQVGSNYELTCDQRIGFRQGHDIRLQGTDTPTVTSQIVNWRGRQASIYCASVDSNGIISDNQVIFHGMIERSPDITDLTLISISIIPISAIIDTKLSGPRSSTSLVHGFHYFNRNARYKLNNIQKDSLLGFVSGSNPIEFNQGIASTNEIMDVINSVPIGVEPGEWSIKFQGGSYSLLLKPANTGTSLDQVFTDDIDLVKIEQDSWSFLDLDFRYTADEPLCINYGINFSSSTAPMRTRKDPRDYQFDLDQDQNLYFYRYSQLNYVEYPIKGIALGWYERGEKYILVKDSLGLPTVDNGSTYPIQILLGDKPFKAIAKTQTAIDQGYLIELDLDNRLNRELPSFGDFIDSEDKIEISRGLLIENKPAGQVILELLESGGGASINGAYDVHLVGCNIKSQYINEDSFLSYESSSMIRNWQFNLEIGDISARDIIESMLKIMGCAIVMDRSTFFPRLKLVSIGSESNEDQPLIIDNDMLVDPSPYWSNYEDIITQFKFIYDLQNEKPTERIINNYAAINQLAGETASEEYKLYGLTSQIVGSSTAGDFLQYFRPTYARLFSLYGQAIRQWFFSITTGKGLTLDVGSSLRVTSNFLKGYDDSYGVNEAIGMVTSIKLSLFNEGCDLKINHYGFNTPTWNASAKIDSVINTSTVEIVSDQHSNQDIIYFKAGDIVSIFTPGANDTKRTRTISSISANQITFTSSHSSSAGDIIQPTTFLNAPSHHTKRAYIDRGFIYE